MTKPLTKREIIILTLVADDDYVLGASEVFIKGVERLTQESANVAVASTLAHLSEEGTIDLERVKEIADRIPERKNIQFSYGLGNPNLPKATA